MHDNFNALGNECSAEPPREEAQFRFVSQ